MPAGDLLPALIVAIGALGVHLLLSGRYGFHRDELYYIAGGHHPAAGYVDQPPLIPLTARLVTEVAGERLWPLRLTAGAAHAVIVVIAGLIARELGGRRWAIGVAAAAVATAPVLAGVGSIFQTVIFEQLWSALAVLLVARVLNGADPRWWLAIGAVFGVGLEAKWTIVLVAGGLAAGFLVVPAARRHLRSVWPWAGLAIALVVWLPNLVWQAANGWPTLEFAGNNNANVQDEGGRLAFVVEQFPLLGPLAVPVAVAGLVWLWRRSPWRAFAAAVGAMFVVLLILGGKGYYLASMYVMLFAAGGVAAENWASARSGTGSTPTAPRRHLYVVAALVVGAVVGLPIAIPIAPQETYVAVYHKLNEDMGEQMGWPELVDQVATVYQSLPPDEQADAWIVTASYGEAAAIDLYGPSRGIPRGTALSGHNSYHHWWPDGEPSQGATVITVRYSAQRMRDYFGEVEQVGTVANPWDLENEVYGTPILMCREPLETPAQLRDELRHYE